MPPVAERPIRVRFEHTRYGHWGERSGYPCFVAHLDPLRFQTQTHGAADNDDELAPWLRPLKPWLRQTLRRRPMKWYKVSDLTAELNAAGRCLAGQVDLVHFLDGEHSGQLLPRLLGATGSRVRTVATFHQPPDLLENLLDPDVLRRLDHIVLMSPSQRPYFEGRVADEKVSVILHGVDTEFFRPTVEERSPGALRCITAGHWLRDWPMFRAVAQRLPSVQFHIVTGRDTGAEDLPNVVRHVDVDDATLASLYRDADILFLPLQDTTANNALLEGIASGLPTIATDLPAVRAYLPGREAILVPKGDVGAAVAAVQRMKDEPALRQRMGALARNRAEALSWRLVAARYEDLYAELLPRSTTFRQGAR